MQDHLALGVTNGVGSGHRARIIPLIVGPTPTSRLTGCLTPKRSEPRQARSDCHLWQCRSAGGMGESIEQD